MSERPSDVAEMRELYTKPGHLIRRAHQLATALFAEECGELTPVQYAALWAIAAQPGIDATRVSALIAFDRSTIGDVLERLEGKGWIRRETSPTDRRVKLLYVTEEGSTVLRTVAPAVERVQARLLQPLSPDERSELIRLLARLVGLEQAVEAPRREAPTSGVERLRRA
ncbi:MAG: MarR family winged helix-turn-helix transcriptional regulator [Geminicoccaceae bacterium]|nr:MarR family winged helix-turn-helix transcriptional regulator [Geminicoccaceae bacterium]MCX7630427.1 MarR family winged helix-turn-helix transcriptional regulator [Geminicoccaceae bacterium]MDW8125206.1 MarR family winged helix-turn-helix transcriptional regulator [Geminicoccaceae bacterium]